MPVGSWTGGAGGGGGGVQTGTGSGAGGSGAATFAPPRASTTTSALRLIWWRAYQLGPDRNGNGGGPAIDVTRNVRSEGQQHLAAGPALGELVRRANFTGGEAPGDGDAQLAVGHGLGQLG